MATGIQSIYDEAHIDSNAQPTNLCSWDKFAQVLLDRHVPGVLRRERLAQERYEWLAHLEDIDDDQSSPDSLDAEIWAPLPISSEDEGMNENYDDLAEDAGG